MSTDQSAEIRRLALIAMFSDDHLMEILVLKGGNALDIAYGVADRASFDLDFSMAGEFAPDELPGVKGRIERALLTTFRENGYDVFDIKFTERPTRAREATKDFWGGYRIEFKLIKSVKSAELGGDIEEMRKRAAIVAPQHGRKFKIDISKFECCDPKRALDVDGFTIHVCTPEMFVFEKLRAICQQMPDYTAMIGITGASARARDFFDIYTALESFRIHLPAEENLALVKRIFAAKRVPVELIAKIQDYREYHRPDFTAVQETVRPSANIKDFDFYFDYVVNTCRALEPLWEE